jgi:predicted aconitase with swiveling domain
MIIDSKNYRNKLDDCVQNKYRNHTPTDSQTTSFHPPGTLNMNTIILNGRVVRAGKAEGEALVSPDPIGFLGGVDPQTGVILDQNHPLKGECIADKILVFPHGKGSTVGSYTILRLARNGVAPRAMINAASEAITAVGAIIADIPMVDLVDIGQIHTGDWVTVTDGRVEVSPQKEKPA